MIADLLSLVALVSALLALLGAGGIVLALSDRRAMRRQYRGLPPPDCVSERNRRALAAYRNNARAYSGLRRT